MIVAYAATRNLYPWLRPSITSLLEHNSVEKIYLIIEDDYVPPWCPKANYEVINVSEQKLFTRLCPNWGTLYTYMAMMRATYADLLSKENRVISLDVDTIICDSLLPIWETDLTGKWMTAAVEYLSSYDIFRTGTYVNIGVAVFNLDEMRKDNATKLLVDMLNARHLPCIEQDALNYYAVIPNKWVEMPTRFNESVCTGFTKNPAVVHYAGFSNWTTNMTMPRREYLDKYLPLSQK